MADVEHIPSPEAQRFQLAMKELNGLQTKVGWFEGNKYPDGTPVAYVASIQEFGYPAGGIPPRPFIRPTISAQQGAWTDATAKMVRRIGTGQMTARSVMETLGGLAAGDIRKAIAEVTAPPLDKRTLAARRSRGNNSTKPLVDTRIMQPTVTSITEATK